MTEENTNKPIRNDEIDLLDLFNRMGKTVKRWGSSLVSAVLIAIVFMIKKWIPLSISLVLGIIAAYLSTKTANEMYSSELILKNNTVSNFDMIEYLNRLHVYCNQGNLSELSDRLNISKEEINKIKDIQSFWIISHKRERIPLYVDYENKYTVSDTANIRMQDRMVIRIIMKSKIDLNAAREGIITFINSDSLFQQKNRLRLRQNQELLERLYIDIDELDSLQKVKYFEETRNREPQKGAQMIFLQQQNTQLVYNDIYGLYSRRQSIETERDLYNGIITVISDFSLPKKADINNFYSGQRIIALLFLATLLVLVIIANRKRLLEIYNKY
jgi:hypothetical protein